MLIDYLRYVAFGGRLRQFFSDALYSYVDPEDSTGQHLRFAPDYLEEQLRWLGPSIVRDLYWEDHSKDVIFSQLKKHFGLIGGLDTLTQVQHRVGRPPATFTYREVHPPELQIMVDIDPARWTRRYIEPRSYEGVPIVYRQAGPATGDLRSGDKVFDQRQGPKQFGTVCGLFRMSTGQRLALTCGHVAPPGSQVLTERRRRLWRLPLWSHRVALGTTIHHETCGPARVIGNVQTRVDAALIEVGLSSKQPESPQVVRQASIKPIASILQEEPVLFRGGGRTVDTLARVSAVTVRKSIDLFKDGQLREVGDVLMLGHRQPMYTAQRVSRPGDSGAAVRQGFSAVGPFTKLNEWHGMIVGGDDTGAFATHAEHLWAWTAQVTGDSGVEFDFDV